MTAINTSLWQNNATLHNLNTSALNAYVNNGTNLKTINETTTRANVGNHRERSCGIKVINSPNTSGGFGKSVRPPQRFTRGLTGGGHVHFIPNVETIRLYGAVQEGSSGIPSPTGVIGIGIETLRLSSVADTTNFPTGNDAEAELDIWIYDKDDTTKVARLSNYPITNTGLGTNWDPFSAQSVLWRGALGVSKFDRTYLFHNTQSNAWVFDNWSLTEMWNDSGNWIVAYRIHDVVAPYELGNSGGGSNFNAGIYTYVAPEPFNETISSNLMFNDEVTEDFNTAYNETIDGSITFYDSITDNLTNTWAESVAGGIRLSTGDLDASLRYDNAVNADITLSPSLTETWTGLTTIRYDETLSGYLVLAQDTTESWSNAPLEDDLSPIDFDGNGFVPVITGFWKRLGLPV